MNSDESAARGQPPAGPVSNTEQPADPARRQFFRAFGRQTVAGAGNVVGAADALRRGGTAAATELLGMGFGSPAANAARMQVAVQSGSPGQQAAQRFSSPYAYSDDAILLLDQRRLPEERATVACTEASEVGAALRAGVIGGGPILAEVAAHTLVLAVAAAGHGSEHARRRAFETAAETLLAARPTIRAVAWAVERMRAAHERLPAGADGPATVVGLRHEAEAIAMELALDHARLGRLGVSALPEPPPAERLELLFHGEMGPLSCGLVGTGFSIVRSLRDAGRGVHVWVTDGGPRLRSGALTSFQLAQLEVPHTAIADAAVGWLLENRRIEATVIRLDTIDRDGASLAPIGAANAAGLASAAGVPVFGCATTAAVSADATTSPGPELAPTDERRLEPLTDALPPSLLQAILTEEGVVRPPYADSIATAVAARSSRRAAEATAGAPV